MEVSALAFLAFLFFVWGAIATIWAINVSPKQRLVVYFPPNMPMEVVEKIAEKVSNAARNGRPLVLQEGFRAETLKYAKH